MMAGNYASEDDDDLVGLELLQNRRICIDKKDRSVNKNGSTYRGRIKKYSYFGKYEKGKEHDFEECDAVITADITKLSLPREERMEIIRKCKNVRNVVPVIMTSVYKKKNLTVYNHFDSPFLHYISEKLLSKQQFWYIIFDYARALTDLQEQKNGCNPNTLLPRNFVVTNMEGKYDGSLFDFMDRNIYEQEIYYGKTFLGNRQQSISAKFAYCILKFALQDEEKFAKGIPEADVLVNLFDGLLEPFRVYLLRDLLKQMVQNNNFRMMKFWHHPTWWNFSVVKDFLDCSRKFLDDDSSANDSKDSSTAGSNKQEKFNSIYREAHRGWKRKITNWGKDNKVDIEKFFDYKNKKGELPYNLLCYARIFNAHITENNNEMLRKHFQLVITASAVAMQEQSIETDKSKLDICISVLLKIFPRLLHDVYKFNSNYSHHDILEGFYNGRYQSIIEHV